MHDPAGDRGLVVGDGDARSLNFAGQQDTGVIPAHQIDGQPAVDLLGRERGLPLARLTQVTGERRHLLQAFVAGLGGLDWIASQGQFVESRHACVAR